MPPPSTSARGTSTRVATPATGLVLSTWWLGEPLGADLIAGAALILGGVACAAWPGRR